MPHAIERMEFAPPATPGLVRAILVAIAAHAVLLAVLTTGISWTKEPPPVVVEAELWSALPTPAAPVAPPAQPVEAAPDPQPTPVEQTTPQPTPEPVTPPSPAPDIAQKQEKLEREKRKQQELAQKEQAQKALAQQQAEEKARQKAKEEERLAQLAKQKEEQERKRKEATDQAKRIEEQRQQNLKRLAALAGSGSDSSSSNAAASSGSSAAYAARVRARIKPNVTFIETIVGNPTTEVEVRTAPDGTITSSRIVKSSGSKSWDTAALNAIEKTAVLPRDESGHVPSPFIIVLSPQELIGR